MAYFTEHAQGLLSPEPLTEEGKAKCKKLEVLNFIMMNFKHTEIWKLLCSQQCLTICHIYLCEALNVNPDIISYLFKCISRL